MPRSGCRTFSRSFCVSRFSAMGQMSSTLAHELNQPLTAITNYVKACGA